MLPLSRWASCRADHTFPPEESPTRDPWSRPSARVVPIVFSSATSITSMRCGSRPGAIFRVLWARLQADCRRGKEAGCPRCRFADAHARVVPGGGAGGISYGLGKTGWVHVFGKHGTGVVY